MQHLRLVGVHEDGLHLLLADDEGHHFSVPLDDSLRAAVRRDRPRLGQLQIEISGGLRPKDVQAMIRAGHSAEEVAERAGWPVEKVHRYEGPILAEREHVAGLARQVRLRPRGGSHGAAPTLEARVSERLRTREIDTVTARWDSRRTDKGAWTVLLLFTAGGREREAAWQFDPLARTVSAVDDEARWLSEDEDQQAPGPIPAPHLSASSRPSRVYDVEAEGGVGASTMRRREGETVDLMAAMRERSAQRGRRRRPKSTEVPGLDEAPEEALPLEELAGDPRDELPPPAHTHPEDDPEVVKTGSVEQRVGVDAARRKARRTEPTQPVRQAPEPTATDQDGSQEADPAPAEPESVGTREPERAPAAEPESGAERHGSHEVDLDDDGADIADDVADEAPAEPLPAEQPLRPATRRREDSRRLSRVPAAQSDLSSEADDRDESAELEDEGYDVVEQRAAAPAAKPAPRPAPPARKSGRPSVPSWDDIMFGRKND
ncbi:septation protein SepH [Terrabacter sp. Ter38]|uniref:septation protein SepH n=1 Tax=Terrabacter sp. Ter38 TaxID=2926030 RepID=UPI002118DD7B|nr:septation protein SepH [Terrabacter sp. Ter38]